MARKITVGVTITLFLMSLSLHGFRLFEFIYQVDKIMLAPDPDADSADARSHSTASGLAPTAYARNIVFSFEVCYLISWMEEDHFLLHFSSFSGIWLLSGELG